MNVFARKATAIKYKKPDQIICNDNIKKYFLLESYEAFARLISSGDNAHYYEFITDNTPVNLFFDVEIYNDKHPHEFDNHKDVVRGIKNGVENYFSNYVCKFIVLSSHNEQKRSYHIITRMSNLEDSTRYYVQNVKIVKSIVTMLFQYLTKQKIIDCSVYREGLFRTIHSTKENEARPFVRDSESDDFEITDTFVGYCPGVEEEMLIKEVPKKRERDQKNNKNTKPPKYLQNISKNLEDLADNDIEVVKRFVRQKYKYRNSHIREVFIDRNFNCIIVSLNDTFCYNIDREHQSNHQYIVIDTYSSKQKCHDIDCKEYKHEEIKISNFPKELNEIILKCLKVNKHEQELIEKAIDECKDYITKNFDENIEDIQFDKQEMVFRGNVSNSTMLKLNGKCPQCHVEHQIGDNGYCLKCTVCESIFPKNQLIPVDDRYKNLNTFWMRYNQLVNNGTVNINITNNNYFGEEEFSCDVQLDNSIFKNKEITKMYNQILDGHKVVILSELMSKLEVDFKYTNGEWYHFDGSIWRQDKECLEFRKRIVKLSSNFKRIQQYYENKQAGDTGNNNIIKNVKSLINKLHKTGFEDEIIKGGKMYYNDESFIKNLNSKKHLVPFSNGVFDLLENKFRKTTKEDYVNLIANFDYNEAAVNQEVYEFIDKILPNKAVRDYVLKKLSECLNGDIPNTNFLMFIGDGANGKSQLLNLMKLAMGELAEKVEVTLLTRKRNNANEANSEKIKLMNKRFAFLSEPEDGEKINIGLLKELTGSEEIVARGLYQESVSFVMEAKLFLACNELPEIKGEDSALWRRIRVVDFPSRFVDDPSESNEYKIDRTLPSRMREDISWRQTFINILLEYYFKDVKEPYEVQIKTNEYRAVNTDFFNWLNMNVEKNDSSALDLKDTCDLYLGRTSTKNEKSELKKLIEKWIKEIHKGSDYICRYSKNNGVKYNGWKGFGLIDN